ncbi:MAG: hypothetical protein AD742_13830 [Methylibium sp. NZG]|nr:MAG: hypothetical protein AD742_13830 [Methylibium sp. NZG]
MLASRAFFALAVLILSHLLGPAAMAQVADPWKDWQSADSAHFRIHYRTEHRAQAERAARAAERAYPRITQLLKWEPRGRTEIVLFNEYDLPNGYATPLPYNVIGVFLAPADDGQLLDNSDWLDLLLTHEFTHTVHLDKVRATPGVLQSIFGRVPWFFPNVFQPGWAIEGLAVYTETDAARGRGRLRGPVFEAMLRAQAAKGFPSLAELNADGRTLPVSKIYLYGAYFYDFLARRYGPDAIFKYVEQYSGNIVPRLHTNPREITGKTLDVLWDEFLADLRQRVAARNAELQRQPEAAGQRMDGPLFDIGAVAALPDGHALAVMDDGLGRAELVKLAADGTRTVLADVHPGTHIDVAPDGRVLLAQADVCNGRYLVYDLYRLEADHRKTQLTSCARLRRAVQAGDAIAALHQDGGLTRLLLLDAAGREQRVLLTPPPGTDLIDLAAAPDGRRVTVVTKREGDWQLLEIDLAQAATTSAAPRLLFSHNAPVHGLRHGPAGLEFVAVSDGVYNVWRLDGGTLVRLTHSHTGVVAQAGTQADGGLWLSVIATDGYELRRLVGATPLQRVAAAATSGAGVGAASSGSGASGGSGATAASNASSTATPPASSATGDGLAEGRSYLALRSLYPRSWLPAVSFDRGLQSFGASTFGADALGWHQYAAIAQWETSQRELVGSLEYLFIGQHHLALQRDLTAKAWVGDGDGGERTTLYERHTRLQWLSAFPLIKRDRALIFGVGAALDRIDSVQVDAGTSTRQRDERIAAALVEFDTSGSNWWSEGSNRGQRSSLLYETYKPFARNDTTGGAGYDGEVVRLDLRGFVPLPGRSVLALRHTEVRARGRTEPFQLGGAVDAQLQLGVVLNERDIALRGYRGDEAVLRGTDARVTTIELRTPLADIDRHFMSPPLGINRLSATAFFDIGGAWNSGSNPDRYLRGVGVELLGEVRLLYALGLHLRVGVARGLDEPSGTRSYLSVGRLF